MIIGVGSDIVAKERINKLLMRYDTRFLRKIFTHNEIAILNKSNIVGYVANRFAAKEAFAKALGTGIGDIVSFQDIEIFKTTQGQPFFRISNKLAEVLQQKYQASINFHLTMSNEADYAQAFVVIEQNPQP